MSRILLLFSFVIFIFSCNTEKKREPQPGDDITKEISLKDYLLTGRWLVVDRSSNDDSLLFKYCPFPDQDTSFAKTNTFVYKFKRDSIIDCEYVSKYGVCGAAFMVREGKWSLRNDTLDLEITAKNLEGGCSQEKIEYLINKNGNDIILAKIKTFYEKSSSFLESFNQMKKNNSK